MTKATSHFPFDSLSMDKRSSQSLQQQLAERVRQAIASGQLRAGSTLPSTRAFAAQLGVSRTTVYAAYEQLHTEGYLVGRRGSATRVASVLPERAIRARVRVTRDRRSPADQTHAVVALPSAHLASVVSAPYSPSISGKASPFRVGAPALSEFPHETWNKLVARTVPKSPLGYLDPAGYLPLREAIAAHLRLVRGVSCTPEQVLITAGVQGAIHLAFSALVAPGESVWVEDPGFLGARGAALMARAQVVPVRVDHHGLDVQDGLRRAPNARLAVVTPSHHFPTGVTLAPARRFALLQWALERNAWIIEDDYDSEYRYVGRPAPALQCMAPTGRVLYAGSFSKVLFPALRIGYLVVPESLVTAFCSLRRFIDTHAPTLEQVVLARFIELGHLERHVRRMRVLYRQRRDALVDALAAELGDRVRVRVPDGGMNLVAWIDGNDRSVSARAANLGIEAPPMSRYCIEASAQGLVLGYAPFLPTEIRAAVKRLARALDTPRR